MKIFELEGDVSCFLQIAFDERITALMKRKEPSRKVEIWGQVRLQTMKGLDKKGTPLGDCPYYGASRLIVSEKLVKLIQTFTTDEIEFLPVEIDGKTGYWFMNVLCVLDALDVVKSEFKRFEDGNIMYVIQAQYNDSVINGHHIFKLTNCSGIFITENMKKYLEDNLVIGVTYRDTTERVENPFAEVFERG
jgi:hypothetical protein